MELGCFYTSCGKIPGEQAFKAMISSIQRVLSKEGVRRTRYKTKLKLDMKEFSPDRYLVFKISCPSAYILRVFYNVASLY